MENKRKILLKIVRIHPANTSFMVYLPKIWVKSMDLEKGDEIQCFIEENDLETLKLKKVS